MRLTSNISAPAHTFAAWIEKVNEIAYIFSTLAVTVEANTTGATTTGNGHVFGSFGANIVFANTSLRGGNTSTAANLTITSNALFDTTSNVWFNGTQIVVASNASFTGANVSLTGTLVSVASNVAITGANLSVAGTNTAISSNLNVSGVVSKFSGATVNVTGTTFNSSSNVISTGANVSVTATNVAITGNLNVIGSVVSIAGPTYTNSANVTLSGANVVISGANTQIVAVTVSGLSTLATVNVTSTSELRGVATAYANIIPDANSSVVQIGRSTGRFQFFGNNASFTGTLGVSGISTFTGNVVAPTVNATALVIGANPIDLVGFSNTDLGSNITHNRLVTSFDTAVYRSGKVVLWLKDASNNSQRSELWFTTNTTAVDYTVSGTLYTGATQPASNLIANLNAGVVEVHLVQTSANSYVKGIAELVRG